MKACLTVLCLLIVAVFASPASGQDLAERGKSLFNDPGFAGGSKACSECHPGGKGLEKSGQKSKFRIMGRSQDSLEEAVNYCIRYAIKGKALRENSEDMKAIVAYIKSLGQKAEAPGYAPGYGD